MALQLSVTISSRSHIHRQETKGFFSPSRIPLFIRRKAFSRSPKADVPSDLIGQNWVLLLVLTQSLSKASGFPGLDWCPRNRERLPAQNTVPYGIQTKPGFSEPKGFGMGQSTGSAWDLRGHRFWPTTLQIRDLDGLTTPNLKGCEVLSGRDRTTVSPYSFIPSQASCWRYVLFQMLNVEQIIIAHFSRYDCPNNYLTDCCQEYCLKNENLEHSHLDS